MDNSAGLYELKPFYLFPRMIHFLQQWQRLRTTPCGSYTKGILLGVEPGRLTKSRRLAGDAHCGYHFHEDLGSDQ